MWRDDVQCFNPTLVAGEGASHASTSSRTSPNGLAPRRRDRPHGSCDAGLAIAGDYMSAATLLGGCALVYGRGYDGLLYVVSFFVGWPIAL